MITICGNEFNSMKELCAATGISAKVVSACKSTYLLDNEEAFCYKAMQHFNVDNAQLLFAIEQSICVLRLLQQRTYNYVSTEGEVIPSIIIDSLTKDSLTKLVFSPGEDVLNNFGDVDESIISFLLDKHFFWLQVIQKGISVEAILKERKEKGSYGRN